MNHTGIRTLLCVTSLAAATVALLPAEAQACGGTFCDGQVPGPQQMPVDQTGENIMFAIDDTHVEAHIQIQYEGDPARFGWVIPVQAIPDVTAGSQTLFDNLMNSTVPTFTLDQQFETCDGSGGASFAMCAFAADASRNDAGSAADGFGEEGDEDDDGTPDVVKRGFAGAFQYDVLQGGTVQGVVDWLDQAGYTQDPDAPPILQEYLDEEFLFVAIKLRSGVGVDEIHPVVVRYEGMEPCIPIRLTRIAAVPDMGIRAFFLGENRVAPQNYAHVELNPLKFDWLGIANGTGTLYNMAVSLGVDEAEAGQAFVTEYAGTSAVVSQANLRDLAWDSSAFIDAQVTSVVDLLEQQGLMDCSGEEEQGCVYTHPLVEALLADYVPVPGGVDADDFYSCLECWEPQIDQDAWDGAGFAADMEERIIVPGEHAIDLLNEHDYLTRMFTTISPEEMTVDPLFWENPDLPDVSNQYFATRWFACEGPDWVELDDGRVVALDVGGQMPDFEDQPYAAKIQEIMPSGAPVDLEDHAEDIDTELEDWNESQRQVDRGGCGCRSVGLSPEGLLFFGTLFGFAWTQRRRRR